MRSSLPNLRALSTYASGVLIVLTGSMLAGCNASDSGSATVHPNLTELRSEWIVTPEGTRKVPWLGHTAPWPPHTKVLPA